MTPAPTRVADWALEPDGETITEKARLRRGTIVAGATAAATLTVMLLAGCAAGPSPTHTDAAAASYSQICVDTATMLRVPDGDCRPTPAPGATAPAATAGPGAPTTVPDPGHAWYFVRSTVRVPAVGGRLTPGPGASVTFPDAGHATVHTGIPAGGGYVRPDGSVHSAR